MEEENLQQDDNAKYSTESAQSLLPPSVELSAAQVTGDLSVLETPKEEDVSEEMTPQEDLSPTDPMRVPCRYDLLIFRTLIQMGMELKYNKGKQEII